MTTPSFLLLLIIAIVILYLGRGRVIAAFRAMPDIAAGRRIPHDHQSKVLSRAAEEEMLPLEEIGAALASVDPQRRQMLKLLALGSGAFVLGKVLGPAVSLFPGELVGDTKYFRNFRFVEKGRELTFFDSRGNEILTLESDVHS